MVEGAIENTLFSNREDKDMNDDYKDYYCKAGKHEWFVETELPGGPFVMCQLCGFLQYHPEEEIITSSDNKIYEFSIYLG